MSIAIDSARVWTTRGIDNDYFITYVRRRYFHPFFFTSLSRLCIPFHIAAYWYTKERGYIGKKGEGRNGQRVHDTSSSHFTIRNKKNFRTGTRLGRVSQVNVRWIS